MGAANILKRLLQAVDNPNLRTALDSAATGSLLFERSHALCCCHMCGGEDHVQLLSEHLLALGRCSCSDCLLVSCCCCRCEGEGRVQLRRKVRFRVPAGVADGQVLRVKGQGHSGKYGGAPGDLLVKLQVRMSHSGESLYAPCRGGICI